MRNSKFGVLTVALPLSLGLSLALVACGGDSDGNGNGNTGGTSSGGKTSSGGTSASTAGSSTKAGSGGTASNDGGKTSSGGTSQSGNGDLPGDTPLSDLTDDQAQTLCEEFGKKFSGAEVEESLCRFNAVLAAVLAQSDEQAQELCTSTYDECKGSPPDTADNCEKPGSECKATVDELNACIDAYREILGTLGDSVPSCESLTKAQAQAALAQLGVGLMTPAACTTYMEKCPDGPAPPAPVPDGGMP